APGSYQARLTVGGQSATVAFTVVKDPRSSSSDANLEAQQRFLVGIRDKLDVTHDALRRIRAVRAQIADLGKRLRAAAPGEDEDAADPYAAVRRAAKELDLELEAVEEALYQTRNHSLEDALNH